MIWPANLSSHYAFPEPVGLSDPMVLGGVIGTCILVPLLLISTRWTRKVWTGWLIFFLAILPTMGIIRVTIVIAADRYVYLPSIGILVIPASFLSEFWRPPHNNRAVFRRVVVALILIPLISAEAFATRKYLVHWRDSVTPNAAPIHNNLGIARQSRGEFDRAIGHYQRALQIDPGLSHGYYNLGIAFMSKNDPNEASKYFRIAVRINPQDKQSHGHLGKMLAMTGRPIEGLKHLRTAVRLNPAFPTALGDLAWLLATHPDPMVCDAEEALRLAEQALALTDSQDMGIVDTLAAAYAAGSQFDLAVAAASRALQLASGAHDDERADQIRKRLDLYQHGMPFNEDPTDGELVILKVLWERGPTRLCAICEALSVKRKTAPSTVATMLKIMKDKGLVKRVASERGVGWKAELSREKASGGMLQSLMNRLFDGSAARVVMHLLEGGDFSQQDQEEIRRLLDSRRSK